MKILLFLVLAAMLTACAQNNNNIGGPLPMLITDWTDITDGDPLTRFDYTTITPIDFNTNEIIAAIGDDQPIPHRIVAEMLEALSHNDHSPYLSYDKPDTMLTLEEAHQILHNLNPTAMVIHLTDENRNTYISYALWVELFIQLLKECEDKHGVEAANIIVLGINNGQTLTNLGIFDGKNINLSAYLDQEIQILHKNGKILAVLGITSLTPTLKNAMITHIDNFGISIFIGGTERNYVFASDVPIPSESTFHLPQIANIQISGREITAITTADTIISGTIERVRPNIIDLREWGEIPLCPFFTVYGTSPTTNGLQNYGFHATTKKPQDLLVGTNIADFHIINGRIAAAIITRNIQPTNIRVAISTSNFESLVHENVTITGTGAFTVHSGTKTEQFSPGEHFTITYDLWEATRLYISPNDPAHRLKIIGLERHWQNGQTPQYRGTFEIAQFNGGGFIIVNELCIEEYLYAVIPSEMPTSHGLEAAKVQAITARSFALHQIYQNAFHQFGAHVDDSVISQVYNNIPETDISIAAVTATRGQVLTVNGQLVIANYFSTSGGTTANFGEVWPQGSQFPGSTPSHLVSGTHFYLPHNPGDLRNEDYAALFFRSHDIPAFDREFPWFRWQVSLTYAQLTESINANIAPRQAANPAMIQVLCANGNPTNETVQTIGELLDMQITRRGQGGNIMEMMLTGSTATVRVQTEFNIRTLLSPGSTPVMRHDGSYVTNLRLLPSTFFTMEISEGSPSTEKDTDGRIATFFGGGNGHGVGMSQNGVKALKNIGLTYREILKHFYPGVEITFLG